MDNVDRMKHGWMLDRCRDDDESTAEAEAVNDFDNDLYSRLADTAGLVSNASGLQENFSGPKKGPDGVWRQ